MTMDALGPGWGGKEEVPACGLSAPGSQVMPGQEQGGGGWGGVSKTKEFFTDVLLCKCYQLIPTFKKGLLFFSNHKLQIKECYSQRKLTAHSICKVHRPRQGWCLARGYTAY